MPWLHGAMHVGDLFVWSFGDLDAPPIVALHGIKGYGGRWRRFARHLHGHRVVAPDLRGHGRSTNEPPWDVERHVADVLTMLDGLGLERVDLLGHSFGGLIATHLSRTAPDRVGRLVLLDPSVGLAPHGLREQARRSLSSPSFATPAEARADRIAGWPGVSMASIDDEVADHLAQGPDGRWRWQFEASAVVTACSEMARPRVLPPPTVETLLVIASRSGFVSPAYLADCRRALGDRLSVAEVDADHMLYLEAPGVVGDVVGEFLAERSA